MYMYVFNSPRTYPPRYITIYIYIYVAACLHAGFTCDSIYTCI